MTNEFADEIVLRQKGAAWAGNDVTLRDMSL
jgi:hypothetical protein